MFYGESELDRTQSNDKDAEDDGDSAIADKLGRGAHHAGLPGAHSIPTTRVEERFPKSILSLLPGAHAFGATKSDHRHQTVTPQTLEHHLPLNLQHQTLKPARDPDQTPDPTPAPLSLPIAATRATSPTASRSISRSPPPPPASTAIATASTTSVRYRECLRNHAANMGGIVVDGCGEFMPSGEEGTPEALKCAACECHRNFHRKEIGGEKPQCAANCYYKNNNQRNTLPLPQQLATSLPQPQASVHQYHGYPHGFSMTPPRPQLHP
ncbi:hypothetical protein GH714_034052 [Hevea brasiliensis]|uniref:ZF-HD dimerization-type domain-containing protein n=1 Tax=Hevea brasiliensis TaxID=3981 RepID=A0A6A6LPX2_HEVBR|nr:hypothetical protein GH714_034052 [Hevea brasiliensis]